MRFQRLTLSVLLACLAYPAPSPAATFVTWTIQDANFADGSLQGSFTIEYVTSTLQLLTAANVTTTGAPGGYFSGTAGFGLDSNDYYALAPIARGTDCSGGTAFTDPCPYVQLYTPNTENLTQRYLNIVFANLLPITGGSVQILIDPNPTQHGTTVDDCVQLFHCTFEQAYSQVPALLDYRGLVDPPVVPTVFGVVVPEPSSALLLGLGLVGIAWRGRKKSTRL